MAWCPPIASAQPIPRLNRPFRASARAAAHARSGSAGRDHALGLHRFLGVAQIFGGLTLITAYGLGATALRIDAAPSLLMALGAVQVAIGIVMVSRTRALRTLLLRQPGFFVGMTLGPATAVLSLGGSNSDVLFITSAMCWLFPAGYVLEGRRWLVGSAVGSVVPAVVWTAVEGRHGGYDGHGHYLTAYVELASAVMIGLWLGRAGGATSAMLNRWHLVETRERGLIGRLREALADVDRRVAAVASMVRADAPADEIAALRARLRFGEGLSDERTTQTLDDAFATLTAEHADAATNQLLEVDAGARVRRLEITASVAQALLAVVRRQLTNVERHAPGAQTITLTATHDAGVLRVQVQDDGGGDLPFRAGTGTAWSERQVARLGGSARYFAADHGVGYEVCLPVEARPTVFATPGMSISQSLDAFGERVLLGLRYAGWFGDSLGLSSSSDEIGARWLLMPVGAVVIEYVIQRGVPGITTTRQTRTVIASVLIIMLTAVFTIPADSPEVLATATSSAVILGMLIWERRGRWWIGFELLRAIAVVPLVMRHGASTVELVVVYPLGFAYILRVLRRFVDRASTLEVTAADAVGRSTLASAAVSGLSLHHDAVDVVLRAGVTDAAMQEAIAELGTALGHLEALTEDSLDPREVMLTGLQAALARPVHVDAQAHPEPGEEGRVFLAGSIDGITLIELAALAADERASCAPRGVLGRRRLGTLAMRWTRSADGTFTECRLTAEPSLRPPDQRAVQRLESVARTLGIEVASTAGALTLTARS